MLIYTHTYTQKDAHTYTHTHAHTDFSGRKDGKNIDKKRFKIIDMKRLYLN